MTLHLYNTLSRQKERFAPLNPPHVLMYNCGPTVYSEAHIGNFRAFLFADLLRRWIEDSGHTVTQVMNITDVGHMREEDEEDAGEDRMEIAARRENLDPWKIAEKYTDLFFRDLDALGIRRAHHYPRATEHIAQMIAMIEKLTAKATFHQRGILPSTMPATLSVIQPKDRFSSTYSGRANSLGVCVSTVWPADSLINAYPPACLGLLHDQCLREIFLRDVLPDDIPCR